jgi:hypothetical protein
LRLSDVAPYRSTAMRAREQRAHTSWPHERQWWRRRSSVHEEPQMVQPPAAWSACQSTPGARARERGARGEQAQRSGDATRGLELRLPRRTSSPSHRAPAHAKATCTLLCDTSDVCDRVGLSSVLCVSECVRV